MFYKPHNYQKHSKQHIIDNNGAGLFLGMGLGKTSIVLDAVDWLIYHDMSVRKVLVIAPKKVAESTWVDERDKWDQFKHLRISLVLGSPEERIAALRGKADIYVIGRDNVRWLVTHCMSAWPFDMIVFDESSSFKNHASQRFKSIRMVLPKTRRKVILTGTPSPNGFADLWAQMYLLDSGERLGISITNYRVEYLSKGRGEFSKYTINEFAKAAVLEKVKDIVISMSAEDYLELPEYNEFIQKVKLPKEIKQAYDDFEETAVLELLESEGGKISAANAAALMNKLLQFANGAVYRQVIKGNGIMEREYVEVHEEKLDVLEELIEAAQDEPVLVFYSYQHDLERIQKRFGGTKYENEHTLKDWNDGKIKLLLAHPASVAYGLNMQAGGRIIVWFGLPWSLELWQQGNARLYRQGQVKPVIVHKVVCPGTVDMRVATALSDKADEQDSLMDAVKAIVKDVIKRKPNLSTNLDVID